MLFEGGAFDAIFRREAVLDHGAAAQVAHFDLDEAAKIAGRAMLHLKDGVQFVIELDDHARA